jgi:hypothetical protein
MEMLEFARGYAQHTPATYTWLQSQDAVVKIYPGRNWILFLYDPALWITEPVPPGIWFDSDELPPELLAEVRQELHALPGRPGA